KRVVDLLERLPTVDPQALHTLGDALGGYEPQRLVSFLDAAHVWPADRLAPPDREAIPPTAGRRAQAHHAGPPGERQNSRGQAMGVLGVWLACRGGAILTPNLAEGAPG